VIKGRGDQDALALLTGIPANAPAAIQSAAKSAITTINGELALWSTAQNAWYGLSLGSVLLLAAIGLAITFGVMGVINMAHGEMVMLGAYTTFVVQEVIRAKAPWLFDWSLTIAVPLAFLVAGAVGVAIERGIIRWLYGRPLETLLATWGLSLILQQAVRTTFGPTNRDVGAPRWMSGAFDIGHMTITYNRLWIIVFAAAVFALLLIVLKRTAFGLQMRAVTQNRAMASAMGIRRPLLAGLPSASAPASPASPASPSRRSTMSARRSARATSSTPSWSWCSAASAISGARSSALSRSASPTSSWSPMPARSSARSSSSSPSFSSSRSGRAASSR
jgi:urea transport system permease protein